jgi:hypothetical protein
MKPPAPQNTPELRAYSEVIVSACHSVNDRLSSPWPHAACTPGKGKESPYIVHRLGVVIRVGLRIGTQQATVTA